MLTIGKLAALAGTTPNTLRYCEREGVVPPAVKGENGYRLYPQDAAQRLHFIRQAQQCGFTLAEIRVLLFFLKQATEGCPGRSYLNLIRQAAWQRGLPTDYIAWLDRIQVRP